MRILQINAVYGKLSTGTNVDELDRFFRSRGHICTVAFANGKKEELHGHYRIGSTLGQKIHALLSRITGLQGYFSSHSTRKFLKYMDAFSPDVVVLNNLHANYINLPMLLKYLAKKDIATVAVLHDCWLYTGKCCHYAALRCDKWKTQCGKCPAKKMYNKSWFFDRSAKMFSDRKKLFNAIPRLSVVAVSDWIWKHAKQSPVFANARFITRIHNWIDTEQFMPVNGAFLRRGVDGENEKLFLAVATHWDKQKGLFYLQKIAERLRDGERLVVIGRILRGERLPDHVLWIPTVAREDLPGYYSVADVFLQPSLEETFGKVTAEAIACGTPVVCFDSTANPELVGEGCGKVVASGDWEAMLFQARNIVRQGKNSYSQTCRQFAIERFNTNAIFRQYEEEFLKLQQVDMCENGAMQK